MGARGRGVKKLDDESCSKSICIWLPWLIFIYRNLFHMKTKRAFFITVFPEQARGNISGIVHKEFLKVTGDGEQNIRDLLKANPRAILQLPQLEIHGTGIC